MNIFKDFRIIIILGAFMEDKERFTELLHKEFSKCEIDPARAMPTDGFYIVNDKDVLLLSKYGIDQLRTTIENITGVE